MNTAPQTTKLSFTPDLNSGVIPLENIRVATPCRADWNRMEGDDRVRFCQSCAKNVFNLSAMSKAEAEKLIAEKEGHLCVRYYQRADGTVLTDNCPVGLRAVRRPFKWLVAGFAALMASGAGLMAKEASTPGQPTELSQSGLRRIAFFNAFLEKMDDDPIVMGKPAPPPDPAPPIMGEIACPDPTPTPKPPQE